MKKIKDSRGFTIIELLLIMGITSILIGLVTINLLRVQHNTSVSAATDTLIADMKGQQVKAMNGASNGTAGDSYGIYFDPVNHNKYVLFHGTTYVSNDSANFPVALDTNIFLTSTFPLVSGNSVVAFSQLSGEVAGFIANKNTIILKNNAGNEQLTITLNKYGVVTNVN